jgi:hypothetical protein
MFKKLIGIVLLVFIVFLAIKSLSYLPYFTNAVLGSGESPFQTGQQYVDQINKMYPMGSYGASKPGSKNTQNISYGVKSSANIIGKVTLEKSNSTLVLTVESANPNPSLGLHIWLTNTPNISNQTQYIDFGLLQNSLSFQTYTVDMKGGDLDLTQYNNLLIVDSNNNIYSRVLLQ